MHSVAQGLGDAQLVSTLYNTGMVGMWPYTNNQVQNHLALDVTHYTLNGVIFGKYIIDKYNIFPQTWQSHAVFHGESLSELGK